MVWLSSAVALLIKQANQLKHSTSSRSVTCCLSERWEFCLFSPVFRCILGKAVVCFFEGKQERLNVMKIEIKEKRSTIRVHQSIDVKIKLRSGGYIKVHKIISYRLHKAINMCSLVLSSKRIILPNAPLNALFLAPARK